MPQSPCVAVVGCGLWGRNLVHNFAELASSLVVCDVDSERARGLAAQHGADVRSWPDILADTTIPAVALATPAVQHGRMAWQAISAGKHVFVEQPLALRLDEAMAVCELAERRHLTLMVGHMFHYHPAFIALKALVADGTLGRLLYLCANQLNPGGFCKEESLLSNVAPDDVSMILALAGSAPTRVTAVGANCLHPTLAEVATTHLTFADGICAHIHVSWLHPCREQKLVVTVDRAMLVFDVTEAWPDKLRLCRHRADGRNGQPETSRGDAEPVALTPGEPVREECRHFLDCIATGRSPRTDGREGVRVLRVLEAAERSLAGAISTTLPPSPSSPPSAGAIIHESAYVDQPSSIGEGTRIWHFSHVLAGSRIGRHCNIGQNVVIGPEVTIGDGCKIQNNVSLYPGVRLEDNVFCGPSCVFTNVHNPRAEIRRMDELRPTLVRCGATIGANATIVCGVTLGEYCFIAAGAVVTRDVPAFALMAGSPARRMGWMSRSGGRLGPDLVCPIDGRRYRLVAADRLVELEGQDVG